MDTLEKITTFVTDEHIEIVNGIYSYNFTLDLTQEITDIRIAASLLTFEQNNRSIMDTILENNPTITSLNDILKMANQLRLILLESENIDNLS